MPVWRLCAFGTLASLALGASGCGYTHGFGTPPGAEGVKTVAIEIFANKTLEMDIENEFTRALGREILAKARLKIAPAGRADALITGTIDSFQRVALRENRADEVTRYSLRLTVSYRFVRLPTGGGPEKVISSAGGLMRSAEYEVRSAVNEPQARAAAVRKVAREVVSHMFEPWQGAGT